MFTLLVTTCYIRNYQQFYQAICKMALRCHFPSAFFLLLFSNILHPFSNFLLSFIIHFTSLHHFLNFPSEFLFFFPSLFILLLFRVFSYFPSPFFVLPFTIFLLLFRVFFYFTSAFLSSFYFPSAFCYFLSESFYFASEYL